MENNIELKGTLKSNGFHVAIEPTIASIYRELEKILDGNAHLTILKSDEINYRGINQEHHSFDEYNFNFVHSRTSNEIQRIFEAVSGLDDDLKFLKNHSQYLKKMVEDYDSENRQIRKFVQNTPLDYRQTVIGSKERVLIELKNFPQRMQSLKIDPVKCKDSEKQINKILLGEILADLNLNKQSN
jgi:DNA sulfur modification protein DndD